MKKEEKTLQKRLYKIYREFGEPGTIMYHIPNGEKRGPKTAHDLWEMGVLAGVPDFLCHASIESTFYVELKRPGGSHSADQKKFRKSAAGLGIDVFTFDDILTAVLFLQRRGMIRRAVRFTATTFPDNQTEAA